MTKEIAKSWITALRSGMYKQGTGSLRNDKMGLCCLAVLGIHVLDLKLEGNPNGCATDSFVDETYDPSPYGDLSEVLDRTEQQSFIEMNDSYKLSYFEIADYIENKYL